MIEPPPGPGVFFTPHSGGPVLSGTFVTPLPNRSLPRLRVFIDESGDRNFGPTRQSDWFTMTAVIVPDETANDLRFILRGLRQEFGLAPGAMLHWRDHFRTRYPGRRDMAAHWLSRTRDVMVVHALLHKPSVLDSAEMRSTPDKAYNYTAKLLLERVAMAAREWQGGQRIAHVKLGTVGGVDHRVTLRYLNHVATHPRPEDRVTTPWGNLMWPLKWEAASDWDGLQAADIYSGMLHAALHGGPPEPLLTCGPQHRRSQHGRHSMYGYGVKVHPPAGGLLLRRECPWWLELLNGQGPRQDPEGRWSTGLPVGESFSRLRSKLRDPA